MGKKVKCWFCNNQFVPTVGIGPAGCPECGQPNIRPKEYWMTEAQVQVEVLKHKCFTREQIEKAVLDNLLGWLEENPAIIKEDIETLLGDIMGEFK